MATSLRCLNGSNLETNSSVDSSNGGDGHLFAEPCDVPSAAKSLFWVVCGNFIVLEFCDLKQLILSLFSAEWMFDIFCRLTSHAKHVQDTKCRKSTLCCSNLKCKASELAEEMHFDQNEST